MVPHGDRRDGTESAAVVDQEERGVVAQDNILAELVLLDHIDNLPLGRASERPANHTIQAPMGSNLLSDGFSLGRSELCIIEER